VSAEPVRLWIMLAGPDDDSTMAGIGFRPERDVIQMRVALPLPAEILAATRPVATRPFVPGSDDEAAWLWVNNRAFAGHPEQGNWTLEKLREREGAEWFDAAGFLLAEDPDGRSGRGRGLIGSCWTKIHRHHQPMLGEIYVISVDPSRHGEGWGRALTVAGLQWLADQGLTVGMLYTGATNTAAVALYGSLGFTIDHVDRSYLIADSASPLD
jgi:mycothiol synthase